MREWCTQRRLRWDADTLQQGLGLPALPVQVRILGGHLSLLLALRLLRIHRPQSAYPPRVKESSEHAHFGESVPAPTFCTHIDVCMHVWTHTQAQPFMCHGLTKSNQTHKRYTLECNTVWVPVVWRYSLFSLPLSSSSPPPFASSLPWFERGAASCAPALLSGRFCPTWCPEVAAKKAEAWHSMKDCRLLSDPSVMLQKKAHWVWQSHGLETQLLLLWDIEPRGVFTFLQK